MRMLTLVLATFFAAGVNAKPILTVTCDIPVGSRFDQIDGTFQQSKDKFVDVHPVFIVDDTNPTKLLIVFGATKPARDFGVTTGAEQATIQHQSAKLLTAVLTGSGGNPDVVELFSLFPEKGMMFYTKHIYIPVGGGIPSSATFYAPCQFAR